MEALRKKERQDETQLPPKLTVFWVSPPIELNANVRTYFFCRFSKNLTQFMTKLKLSFCYFRDISIRNMENTVF